MSLQLDTSQYVSQQVHGECEKDSLIHNVLTKVIVNVATQSVNNKMLKEQLRALKLEAQIVTEKVEGHIDSLKCQQQQSEQHRTATTTNIKAEVVNVSQMHSELEKLKVEKVRASLFETIFGPL